MNDLFSLSKGAGKDSKRTSSGPSGKYTARDIEVLEGLEPVRRRPGMYIGGVDENGLHHLAAEILDNAMDEAVAGYASRIEMSLAADGSLTIDDNGRGIPVDKHPKCKNRSALEVILTTLHSGAKFSDKVYHTAGGLHGVGASVVNALSERLTVEVARDGHLWSQSFERGIAKGKLKDAGVVRNRRGTKITFWPDTKIFGEGARFRPARLYRMARSKAYLFRGVEIRWECDPKLLGKDAAVPTSETLHFSGGLADYLAAELGERTTATPAPFAGRVSLPGQRGEAEWAVAWPTEGDARLMSSYCNTVPTPGGGTHVQGLRNALAKGLRAYGELIGNRRVAQVMPEDVVDSTSAVLSVFIPEPLFHGQTKDKLGNPEAAKLVEQVVRDHFDHWLSGAPDMANGLLEFVIQRAEERLARKADKDVARKTATRKLRLPGKLADCSRTDAKGTELLLVEGDSAGGTAKQARNRETQAVLPLRGKILNVASAASGKMQANQEISDLLLALGCQTGERYKEGELRYEKVIIMTDADVDGAHIASLLMTFFYRQLPGLIRDGHLYLAMPPLYRLTHGATTVYARDDAHKDQLLKTTFAGHGGAARKVEISRFKGLGEMPAAQLKSTTMDPAQRTLLRVVVADGRRRQTDDLVERLMGRKPELRLEFIQEHAPEVEDLDV
ncbi:MAG: DNA topoisomerase IV subunit B [Alphaproteobacteria bacterium]|nr:DNA topoisomerase IV subunit B [Alphaproteobacteria bacterium]